MGRIGGLVINTRRDFIKICIGVGATISIPIDLALEVCKEEKWTSQICYDPNDYPLGSGKKWLGRPHYKNLFIMSDGDPK